MSPRNNPLDQALQSLRDDEDEWTLAPEARSRVALRVETMIGVAGAGLLTASVATKAAHAGVFARIFASVAGKMGAALLLFSAGVGTGIAVYPLTRGSAPSAALTATSSPVAAETTLRSAAPPPAARPADSTLAASASASAGPIATPTSAASSASAAVMPTRDAALRRERGLIEGARAALLRGDSALGRSLLEQHARDFPSGELRLEREVLARRLGPEPAGEKR